MRKIIFHAILILCGFLVAFSIIEIGYRFYLKSFNPVTVYRPAAKTLNPDGQGNYRGGFVSLDKYGLRNKLDEGILNRRHKILVIGDSLTFGSGVNDDEVFVHHLNELNRELDISFINLGQPGYDTMDLYPHYIRYDRYFWPYSAIIWVYYINDAKKSYSYINWQYSLDHFKEDHSQGPYEIENRIWPYLKSPTLIKHLIQNSYSKFIADKKSKKNNFVWEGYYKTSINSYTPGSVKAINEERYLTDILNFTFKRGVPIFFVLAPAVDQFKDHNSLPQNYVRNIVESYNVPVLDLMEPLGEINNIEDYYLPNDHGHWNAKGHKLVAYEISNFIRRFMRRTQ